MTVKRDDFERITYRRLTTDGFKKSTMSVDPDLYAVYCLISGGPAQARFRMRQWALSIEPDDIDLQASVSRTVHKKMMGEIRILVEKGLVVEDAQRSGRKHVSVYEMLPPGKVDDLTNHEGIRKGRKKKIKAEAADPFMPEVDDDPVILTDADPIDPPCEADACEADAFEGIEVPESFNLPEMPAHADAPSISTADDVAPAGATEPPPVIDGSSHTEQKKGRAGAARNRDHQASRAQAKNKPHVALASTHPAADSVDKEPPEPTQIESSSNESAEDVVRVRDEYSQEFHD